ncbi:hypothetical protein Z043_109448 [Scleropages formosus]|uniref:Proteinase-activated receptor 1 n=1 Tax=Scleropages formosus TaxID=113540 RepID=A0A0P7V947_SCLFO|nr:hypothetical protein Z043_109448 [Scleropages formosus]
MAGLKAATALVLCSLSVISAAPHNGSIVRTFAGFFLEVPDETIDYLDVQEGSASGFGSDQPKHDKPKVVVKHGYHVSKAALQFLTGSMMTIFIPTVYTLVFIISVPLNLFAVVMFVRRIHPKQPAVIFMLNLALADLLFVLLLPFKISYHFHGNNWTYGPGMCRFITAAFYCNMYCSILLMMCISMDRFLAVVHPIDSLSWRSPQNALVVCTTMWLLAVGGVVPILMSEQTVYLPELGITTCHDILDIRHLRGYYVYFFPIFCSVFFFIPLAFSVICYVRVIQALSSTDTARIPKRNRAILMAAAVLAVFLVCFTPTNVILLAHYTQVAQGSHSSYGAYLLSTCIGSISCCLDPFIYYFGSSQCRKQAAGLLHSLTSRRSDEEPVASSTHSSKMEVFQGSRGSRYKKLVV